MLSVLSFLFLFLFHHSILLWVDILEEIPNSYSNPWHGRINARSLATTSSLFSFKKTLQYCLLHVFDSLNQSHNSVKFSQAIHALWFCVWVLGLFMYSIYMLLWFRGKVKHGPRQMSDSIHNLQLASFSLRYSFYRKLGSVHIYCVLLFIGKFKSMMSPALHFMLYE